MSFEARGLQRAVVKKKQKQKTEPVQGLWVWGLDTLRFAFLKWSVCWLYWNNMPGVGLGFLWLYRETCIIALTENYPFQKILLFKLKGGKRMGMGDKKNWTKGEQNILPQNTLVWHENYFERKQLRRSRYKKSSSHSYLPKSRTWSYKRVSSPLSTRKTGVNRWRQL